MQRSVQPEILDSLAPDDPVALANRRDLRTFNFLMGNFRWIQRILSGRPLPGNIFEIGAGDGSLADYLLRKKILSPESRYTGIDLIGRPQTWPESWEWLESDIRDVNYNGGTRTLIANMILHQFQPDELSTLGRSIEQSAIKRLILCEPARKGLHLWQVSMSRLIGIHKVTLHDAAVSIRGGFRRDEVVDELGLDRKQWSVSWSEHFLGANRVICER
jgi:hypothetical protein